MATNKNALIRYRTIDKCLQNRQRRWTLNDLIQACSDALIEFEGKDSNVSKRTVQLDLQIMRSDKLGYNAPIVVYQKKFYTYADPKFSITDIPITETDLKVLSESVEILKQFKDFALFSEMGSIIQKLEDSVYSEQTNQNPIIHLEKNENLKGLEHLETLYQAILKELGLCITYKSFKARSSNSINISPLILKEFNNRWFLVGIQDQTMRILTLALDRIEAINFNLELDYCSGEFNHDNYYKNTIGVTVLDSAPICTILRFDRNNAPYILTKPLHHSQKLIEKHSDGSITISIEVHHNFELDRIILGFGSSVKVISPERMKTRIMKKLKDAIEQYGVSKS